MATKIASDALALLDGLHEKLKFLQGRQFELQGEVQIISAVFS